MNAKAPRPKIMKRHFDVGRRRKAPLKIIPYIGCKSGFAHIFDSLVPDDYGDRIYDVFGGGGGFAFYACDRFGSRNVVYNDHNPVITNFVKSLKKDPDGLYDQYQRHYKKSGSDYYLRVREQDLEDGVLGAGRFFYLAKNAFSGKIRFNSGNRFNSPMRKNARCPKIDMDAIRLLSNTIKHLRITKKDFEEFKDVRGSFVYLDPPYMNNTNGHYNATVGLSDFVGFVKEIQKSNKVMISEQNSPDDLMLASYNVFHVTLNRSLQYFTQKESSREILAVNYDVPEQGMV